MAVRLGTVYVSPQTGEPGPEPFVPSLPPAVENPHFAVPFTLTDDGTDVAVVDQGSAEEIRTCERVIASCPIGARIERPDFGIPWPLFKTQPLDVTGVQAALRNLEPRGEIRITSYDDLEELGVSHVEIEVNSRVD